MKRADLVEVCKKYNLSSSGTKQALEKRIKKAKFFERQVSTPKVVLRHFKNDMYIHVTKDLIVDKKSKQVIGKLDNLSNTIVPLQKNDIELCKSLRMEFKLPITMLGEIQTHRIKTELEEESDDEL